MKNLAIIITGVLSIWAGDKYKNLKINRRRQEATQGLQDSVETDNRIVAVLAILLHEIQADKAKIFRFHNGGEFYDGQAMRKFSLAYLHLRPGVAGPKPADLRDLKSSLFNNMLKTMLEGTKVQTWNMETSPDDYLKSLQAAEGSLQIKVAPLRNYRGEMLGYLSIDWIDDAVVIQDQVDRKILRAAQEVGDLLSYKNRN